MTTVSIEGILLEGEVSEVNLEGGRYTIVGRLGSGGMAQVYRAWDRRLNVWRAVKLLKARRSTRPGALARFEREARVMARLDHPDIVRVYDFDWHHDRPYIVMEGMTGGSLWDWMERHQRPLPIRDAVLVAISACSALAAAHARGVIHRDVKPNNLLIAHDGRCKLTDFGVVLVDGQAREKRGSRLGTEGFQSPEQEVDPGNVDHHADLFGVGATLFTLCTGRRPRQLATALTEPSVLRHLDPALRPVVARACAHDPAARYSDALALLHALDRLMLELPERPDDVPPLYEQQVEEIGIAGVPTAPSMMARQRSRKFRADTVPLPAVRVARRALSDVEEPDEPSLRTWPTEQEMAVGTAGFLVGASVVGVVVAVLTMLATL